MKTYIRKPWSKLIKPDQFAAMMREYESGVTTQAMCAKYGVSRSWLYRERKRWLETERPRDDVICLRAEIARLERVIVALNKSRILGDELLVDRQSA